MGRKGFAGGREWLEGRKDRPLREKRPGKRSRSARGPRAKAISSQRDSPDLNEPGILRGATLKLEGVPVCFRVDEDVASSLRGGGGDGFLVFFHGHVPDIGYAIGAGYDVVALNILLDNVDL